MKKGTRLFFAIVSMCFAVAVLTFGVFAASAVTYTVTGQVSYTVNDVFVDIETELFKQTETLPYASASALSTATQSGLANNSAFGLDCGVLVDMFKTYNANNEIISPSETLTKTVQGTDSTDATTYNSKLNFTFGRFVMPEYITEGTAEEKALDKQTKNDAVMSYAYFILIKVTNRGSLPVRISVQDQLSGTTHKDGTNNVYQVAEVSSNANSIPATGTNNEANYGYIAIGLALADVTRGATVNYNYQIRVEMVQAQQQQQQQP